MIPWCLHITRISLSHLWYIVSPFPLSLCCVCKLGQFSISCQYLTFAILSLWVGRWPIPSGMSCAAHIWYMIYQKENLVWTSAHMSPSSSCSSVKYVQKASCHRNDRIRTKGINIHIGCVPIIRWSFAILRIHFVSGLFLLGMTVYSTHWVNFTPYSTFNFLAKSEFCEYLTPVHFEMHLHHIYHHQVQETWFSTALPLDWTELKALETFTEYILCIAAGLNDPKFILALTFVWSVHLAQ